ncbi:MAG: hypothetical protein EA397_17260 [Deltaproteobacteria bacterium]|nr:MAG: hypothetical protein EA397_17260 [Deltaproteobacteria bacterium]
MRRPYFSTRAWASTMRPRTSSSMMPRCSFRERVRASRTSSGMRRSATWARNASLIFSSRT